MHETWSEFVSFSLSVGFKQVQGLDKTDDFCLILKEEVEKFEPTKEEFLKVSTNYIATVWFETSFIFKWKSMLLCIRTLNDLVLSLKNSN